jgi:hypothetical protein
LDSNLLRKRKKGKEITTRQQVVRSNRGPPQHNTYILILVFAEVIYSVNGLFLEIRKRPKKLDNIDSS